MIVKIHVPIPNIDYQQLKIGKEQHCEKLDIRESNISNLVFDYFSIICITCDDGLLLRCTAGNVGAMDHGGSRRTHRRQHHRQLTAGC